MFEHISKFIPWKTAKQKKQEFLDRLKGISAVRIKTNTPQGTIFVVHNNGTGYIGTFCYLYNNHWIAWGTTPILSNETTRTFTTRQLEVYLTNLMRESINEKTEVKIIDESNCIKLLVPK